MSQNLNLHHKVFHLVSRIPTGQVMTYGQIAKLLNIASPRYVGHLLHQNRDPQNIPCHRVIRSDGTLASGYAFGGPNIQQMKLESEGVVFERGKIDLVRFSFRPNPISLK